MANDLQPFARVAQLRRVCCARTSSGPETLSTARAHWELYIVIYNTTDEWPHHKWPASSRHQPPTVTERAKALEDLGYVPAPDAEWEWQEGETPGYHCHPQRVTFLGTLAILPLEQAQAEGGDR